MFIGIILCLIGAALIETPLIGFLHGEYGVLALICGFIFGILFIVPGVLLIRAMLSEKKSGKQEDTYRKELLEALKPGFREARSSSPLDSLLFSFREHYSAFLGKDHVSENEAIQQDVTQIFRNILQFQKNRLTRLGLTCEMVVRRMRYTKENGLSTKAYSDGKYDITDVEEQVAAKTVYKKDGQAIFTKQDKDTANYTIVQAQQVGDDKIICPNCGVETTRDALLDGCDYCGTKFTVEDLGSRVAVFAFRPDFKLRYEKYLRTRNQLLAAAVIAAVIAVFLAFTGYAIFIFPEMLAGADGGILLTLLASLFAILIASPFYILSFLIVYGGTIFPLLLLLGLLSWRITKWVRSIKDAPVMARNWEKRIRRHDPNFSMAGFYSGVQNKLSSVLFADTPEQIQAFAAGDLTPLLGRYRNVAGMDVNTLEVTDYRVDAQLQYADVDAVLLLTRYSGSRCTVRREYLQLRLIKSVACRTQAVCAPAVLTCKGCGISLDLLQGKRCPYCGRELDLQEHDWVIAEMKPGLLPYWKKHLPRKA